MRRPTHPSSVRRVARTSNALAGRGLNIGMGNEAIP